MIPVPLADNFTFQTYVKTSICVSQSQSLCSNLSQLPECFAQGDMDMALDQCTCQTCYALVTGEEDSLLDCPFASADEHQRRHEKENAHLCTGTCIYIHYKSDCVCTAGKILDPAEFESLNLISQRAGSDFP